MIDKDSWIDALEAGWRLHEPFAVDDTESNILLVAAAVQQHGAANVAIGIAFDVTSPALASERVGFAVYVRDSAEILEELREDLLNYECGHDLVA